MNRSDALQDYTVEVTSSVAPKVATRQQGIRPPLTFIMGRHEAAEFYCRSRGIHPSLFRPVVCWPNLAGFGVKHGYKLLLVHGFSEVEDFEKIIRRAKLFGFEVTHV